MIAAEILAQVKELELHTRRILSGSVIGGTKTRQKGFGFEFDQLRSYQYGDDVRLIDWKSSAKNQNNLMVRQYFEDRNRTILICLDLSASTMFGSKKYLKQQVMQQIAGILALAGAWSSDKVGLILFSDRIEKIVHPAKGHKHVHMLLAEMFAHKPVGTGTDFAPVVDFVAQHGGKQSMVLMISDFINIDIEHIFKKITCTKDVIAISCNDAQEKMMHNVGYVWMQDPETGEIALVHSAGFAGKRLNQNLALRMQDQKSLWAKSQVDLLMLQNQETMMHDLLHFFQKRML
jgi:uncharacterized protein (DUF58 family)